MAKTKKRKAQHKRKRQPSRNSRIASLKKIFKPASQRWQKLSRLSKFMLVLTGSFLLICLLMYGVASWYRLSHRDEPLQWGMSWSFKYARELGIDPYQGFEAVTDDLGFKRMRLMSYWDIHEPQNDQFEWYELDWQLNKAQEVGAEVSLAIGLRQPRWPECHWPEWAQELEFEDWKRELNQYMGEIIMRYDNRGVIVEYQLENEYFLGVFGECPDHSRERLVEEFNYVKALTDTPIVVSRSNNATPSWPIGEPRADKVAASIYKRVFDATITKQYFEYPYPAWFYAFLAGMTEITTDRQTYIHELQAEPWGTAATVELSDAQQAQTMDARRLKTRLKYGYDTGMRTIDIWGGEWYYWRKTTRNDPSLWETIRTELPNYN